MKTSNHYPSWWNTTITVYNKYVDKQTQVITWHRTVIENCYWQYVGDKVAIGKTVLETNDTICRIPIQENFVEKYEWDKIPNDKQGEYFTLASGDIVARGSVDDEINEYKRDERATDFIEKHKALQGCMQIDQVALNYGGGRCNEHYYIKGV